MHYNKALCFPGDCTLPTTDNFIGVASRSQRLLKTQKVCKTFEVKYTSHCIILRQVHARVTTVHASFCLVYSERKKSWRVEANGACTQRHSGDQPQSEPFAILALILTVSSCALMLTECIATSNCCRAKFIYQFIHKHNSFCLYYCLCVCVLECT